MTNPSFNQDINFNKSGFEQVKTLYDKKKENYAKNHIEVKDDKEIVRDVINDIFDKEIHKKDVANMNVKTKTFTVFSDDDDDDEKRSNKTLEELVKIAFENNITSAIAMSFKTSNAYLIDRLHDILIDRFYDELMRHNKIKK